MIRALSCAWAAPPRKTRDRFATLLPVCGMVLLSACQDSITGPGSPPGEGPPIESPPASSAVNPLTRAPLFVDHDSNARRQATLWRSNRPLDAEQMEKIANQPQARWFGDWNQDVRSAVDRATTAATQAGALPVLVAYNIPQRDCGLYSAGGSPLPSAYRQWISDFAAGIGERAAVVILEPDAVALTDCLSPEGLQTRFELLRFAVETLKARPRVALYVDAGNPRWHPPAEIARRLRQAGIERAEGFSLNVSNFIRTEENIRYGREISALTGGKHFVIDTSRNGRGPTDDFQWCNPRGRALGPRPTTRTADPLVDAYLWIKAPGESDGACNGSPPAGIWWPEYALELARNAEY